MWPQYYTSATVSYYFPCNRAGLSLGVRAGVSIAAYAPLYRYAYGPVYGYAYAPGLRTGKQAGAVRDKQRAAP
jgi:hypothetical protein